MHFSCNKKDLMNAVSIAVKAVASKPLSAIQECILIEAAENYVSMKCTDLVLSIQSGISANVVEKGKAAVNARLFFELVAKFPEEEIFVKTDEGGQLQIECAGAKTALNLFPYEEFPEFPETPKEKPVAIKENNLRKMIHQTIFSSAVTEDKPILTGALLEAEEEQVKLVALDGYRMAMRKEAVAKGAGKKSAVIPAKSLRETARILSDSDAETRVYIGNKTVLVENGESRIFTRLLEGDFINYKAFLPTEFKTRAIVPTEAFCVAIERASILSREENNNLIKISIKEDRLIITANSEIGRSYEEMPAAVEGKELDIAFNARYLTDVLKNIEAPEVAVDFNSNISPCVLRPVEGESFYYLVLPVQIRG